MVVIVQSGYIQAKWFYSGKSGCNRVKVVVFGQTWLYSGKRFYLDKNGCIRKKRVYSGNITCICSRW